MKGIRQANNLTPQISIEIDDDPAIFSEDRIFKIHLDRIVPCPFEPQARRRAKFKAEELEELGNSIVNQGLLSPIVVRPSRKFVRTNAEIIYEIVFGERRWLASRVKNLSTIKCFVRDLSDAQVLEMQYQENHQRNDNDPLDDAFLFKFLQEREKYSILALADKFGISEQTVINRLKLNDLIPEIVEELSSGLLPLGHAYYMARYPEAVQREIVQDRLAYLYYDSEYRPTTFDDFKEQVEGILQRLKDATFDPLDPNLHPKKLICPNCIERTGFSPMLFPDLRGDDQCLNRTCFKIKTETNLTLQRMRIADKLPNPERKPIEELAKEVPLVTERKWTDEKTFKGAKPIVNQNLLEKPECSFSELSLAIDGRMKGQQVYICRNDECPVHYPKPSQSIPAAHLETLEDDFNYQVAARNRLKVLRAAMNWFDDYKLFWTFDDLMKNLIVQLLNYRALLHGSEILWILQRDWNEAPRSLRDQTKIREFVGALSKRDQSRLLFLLTASFDADEVETLSIAKEYTNLDFLTLDAETRVELSPTEFRPQAKEYLAAVKAGEAAAPPRFWYVFDDVETVSDEEN